MTQSWEVDLNTHENVNNIKADRNRIVNWTDDTWQMTFNVENFKVMHIGNVNINTDYTMRDIQIDMQEDLGILISSDLKATKYFIEVKKIQLPIRIY